MIILIIILIIIIIIIIMIIKQLSIDFVNSCDWFTYNKLSTVYMLKRN